MCNTVNMHVDMGGMVCGVDSAPQAFIPILESYPGHKTHTHTLAHTHTRTNTQTNSNQTSKQTPKNRHTSKQTNTQTPTHTHTVALTGGKLARPVLHDVSNSPTKTYVFLKQT